MVKILSVEETREVLARHPEIRADEIPTYGLQITDSNRRLLVGLKHATGEIVIMDISVYDDSGQLVDKTTAEIQSAILDLWKLTQPISVAIISTKEAKAFSDTILGIAEFGFRNIGPILIGGLVLYVGLEVAKLWKK